MPLLHTGARFATSRMPKVITPGVHAVLDYAVAGAFLLMGARMWRRNKRAALASFTCGAATALNSMVTDYPGGVAPVIDYDTHGRVDGAIAALTAAAPKFLGFSEEDEARFFSGCALAETVIVGLTDYEEAAGDSGSGPE